MSLHCMWSWFWPIASFDPTSQNRQVTTSLIWVRVFSIPIIRWLAFSNIQPYSTIFNHIQQHSTTFNNIQHILYTLVFFKDRASILTHHTLPHLRRPVAPPAVHPPAVQRRPPAPLLRTCSTSPGRNPTCGRWRTLKSPCPVIPPVAMSTRLRCFGCTWERSIF